MSTPYRSRLLAMASPTVRPRARSRFEPPPVGRPDPTSSTAAFERPPLERETEPTAHAMSHDIATDRLAYTTREIDADRSTDPSDAPTLPAREPDLSPTAGRHSTARSNTLTQHPSPDAADALPVTVTSAAADASSADPATSSPHVSAVAPARHAAQHPLPVGRTRPPAPDPVPAEAGSAAQEGASAPPRGRRSPRPRPSPMKRTHADTASSEAPPLAPTSPASPESAMLSESLAPGPQPRPSTPLRTSVQPPAVRIDGVAPAAATRAVIDLAFAPEPERAEPANDQSTTSSDDTSTRPADPVAPDGTGELIPPRLDVPVRPTDSTTLAAAQPTAPEHAAVPLEIHVRIGRVEVRSADIVPPPRPHETTRPRTSELSAYLRARAEGRAG